MTTVLKQPIISTLKKPLHSTWLFLLLLFIFIGSLYLRLHNLVEFAYFGNDMSRDAIAVEHIVSYGEQHFAVPIAAGGAKVLKNSFLYYYLIIPFYLFGKSPESFLYSMNILASLNIFILFWIGKSIKGNWAGLISAALFGLNTDFVSMTTDIWQPFFLSVFLPIAFLCLLKSWQNKSYPLFLTTIGIFGLLAHIHWSVVSLGLPLLVYFVAMCVHFWKREKRKVFVAIGVALGLLFFWLFATQQLGQWSNLFTFFADIINQKQQDRTFQISFTLLKPSAFGANDPTTIKYLQLLSALTILAVVVKFIRVNKSDRKKEAAVIVFFALSCLSFLVTLALFPFYYYYVFPYFFLFCIFLGYGVETVCSWKVSLLVLLTIAAFSWPSNVMRLQKLNEYWHDTDIYQRQLVVKEILNDAISQGKSKENLRIGLIVRGPGYFIDGHEYWYYLEKFVRRRLISLGRDNAKITLLSKPENYYLICESPDVYEADGDACVAAGIKKYEMVVEASISQTPELIEIIPSEQDTPDLGKFRVFKFIAK